MKKEGENEYFKIDPGNKRERERGLGGGGGGETKPEVEELSVLGKFFIWLIFNHFKQNNQQSVSLGR